MQCSQCSHENPAGQKFCGECGTRLILPCSSCGTANAPTSKFCGECGTKLAVAQAGAGQAAATQPAAPAPAVAAASPAPPAPAVPTPAVPVPAPAEPAVATGERFASPESYTPRHLAEKILKTRSAVEGERKQVTVMFTDVSGFTAMSEQLDPEEIHTIMDRAFGVIMGVVHGLEGTINQFLGDGVMALFGAPIAHEDHAQRALKAALAIQEGLQPIRDDVKRIHGREFRMRIGLNSGPVVVGAIGRDLRMDYTALGDTVNLAARLLNVAQPGQIVASRHTKELSEGFFLFEDLGDFQLKGKTEPQRAFAVTDEIRGRTRLEVSRERGLTPLVGRRVERRRLDAAFHQAAEGHGRVAVIAGDAGVGKSRLLYEFLRGLDARDHLELEATCASYGQAMAYRPILELFRRYLDLAEGMTGEQVRNRVVAQLDALGLDGGESGILLAHFLGVSAPPDFLQRVQGAELKARTDRLLRSVLFRESEARPLVIVVENVHWIDATSEDFLKSVADGVGERRLLLILTTRPGPSFAWLPPTAETLDLQGLDPADLREMVHTLLAARAVSEPLLRLLLAKGEGNPLYVEEIIRQLQETGGIVIDGGEARLATTDVAVPETIRDIIAARVDRLGESLKHTLQVASVVGRRFGVTLVSSVIGTDGAQVAAGLKELHDLDFVFPAALDPELMYSFKHALTQDVVYATLLERRRRHYHATVGVGLEKLYIDRLDEVVELLAYHCDRGGEAEKAVGYYRRSGVKAQARAAHPEAAVSFEHALAALARLPETPERQEQGIDVRLELRGSLYPLGEFEKMLAYLREAEALASALDDARRLGVVSINTGEYYRQTGRFAEARRFAEQALAMGDRLQDVALQSYAGQYLALACHALGDYRRAAELLRVVTQSQSPPGRTGTLGMTVGSWDAHMAISFGWLARCLAELGEFDEGVEAGHQAMARAEGLKSPYALTVACMGLGYPSLVRGDLEAAGPVLERACSVAREANLALLRPQATRFLGGAYLLGGRIEEGVALVQAAADEVESRQLLMQHAAVLGLLGEAYSCADRLDEAAATAQRALTIAQERGQRGDAAVALRVLADAAARSAVDVAAHTTNAERRYLAVIALAGGLEMRPELARGHLGLGRLYLRTGDRPRAADQLLLATRLFIAMDMRLWLRQAVSSLSELGHRLIVAREHVSLYEYLSRALIADRCLDVVLGDAAEGAACRPGCDDGENLQHVAGMLQSHGLSITG